MPRMSRACADLQPGDRVVLLGRVCTVTKGPTGNGGRSVRFTVALPGGAPQTLVEPGDHLMEVVLT